MRLAAVRDALSAAPHQVRDIIGAEFDRLASHGIRLPYTDDQLPLIPAILPVRWRSVMGRGSAAVFAGIEHLFAEKFRSDVVRLADYLLLEPGEKALLSPDDPGPSWAITARPDFMDNAGEPAMIETNVTTSLGLLEAGLLGEVLAKIPAVGQLIEQEHLETVDPARSLVRTVAGVLRGRPNPLIVMADWRGEVDRWAFVYRYLEILFAEVGLRAEIARIDQLQVRDGGVFLGSRKIDLIYRFFTTIALRDPLVAEQHAPILHAVRSGKVLMFGGYGHKLFTPKLFLALLSDEENAHHVPPSLRDAVEAIVPWTRIVADRSTVFKGSRIDLLPYAAAHKDLFVLKPNLGYGGSGVIVGPATDVTTWQESLVAADAASDHWLLQSVVAAPEEELLFLRGDEIVTARAKVDYGAFVFERAFAGAARRNATVHTGPALTNLTRGGGLSPVFFTRASPADVAARADRGQDLQE